VLGGLITTTLVSLLVLPALYLRFGGRGLAPADELLLRWAEAEPEPERIPEPEKEEKTS